jgi:hypothetical protein
VEEAQQKEVEIHASDDNAFSYKWLIIKFLDSLFYAWSIVCGKKNFSIFDLFVFYNIFKEISALLEKF